MKIIRKAIAIFLFIVFLFNLVGYIGLFKVARYQVQKEIKGQLKKNISNERLHVISVELHAVATLDWEEEGREFKHGGRLYDVVWSEIKNGFIYYHCLNDEEETHLFAHLDSLVNDQLNSDGSPIGKTAKNLSKFVSLLHFLVADGFRISSHFTNYVGYFNYSFSLFPVLREVLVPPPDQAC